MFGMDELKGKVIWLTGASGGLGHGMAMRFAEAGFRLALHAFQNRTLAKELENELLAAGSEAIVTEGDLSDERIARGSVEKIIAGLGMPYGLVHAAGPLIRKRVTDHSSVEFQRMINGNLTTFFEAARSVIPGMREEKAGRLIAFGIAGAHHTIPMRFLGPHLAAKSGLIALTRTLALEEAPFGITVNAVSPGHIENKSLDRNKSRNTKAGHQFPMGHPGSFEDIADAVLYLLSPAASYVTGTVLEVTGGWMGDEYLIKN